MRTRICRIEYGTDLCDHRNFWNDYRRTTQESGNHGQVPCCVDCDEGSATRYPHVLYTTTMQQTNSRTTADTFPAILTRVLPQQAIHRETNPTAYIGRDALHALWKGVLGKVPESNEALLLKIVCEIGVATR